MTGKAKVNKRLKDIFLGEYVFITLRNFMASNYIEDAQSGDTIQTQGASYAGGYVLDIDEEFIYLGSSQHEVDSVVMRRAIIKMDISSEVTIAPQTSDGQDLQ